MRVLALILSGVLCVAYGQLISPQQPADCRKNPCSQGCPQPPGNRLLKSLDLLTPQDINDILVDRTKVEFYMECVLELAEGTCDATGAAMKEGLREWANTKKICNRCSPCQSRKLGHIINQLQRRYKVHYDAVQAKYQG